MKWNETKWNKTTPIKWNQTCATEWNPNRISQSWWSICWNCWKCSDKLIGRARFVSFRFVSFRFVFFSFVSDTKMEWASNFFIVVERRTPWRHAVHFSKGKTKAEQGRSLQRWLTAQKRWRNTPTINILNINYTHNVQCNVHLI